MPRGQKSKLRAREKRHHNRAETQGHQSVQATAGEEKEAACCSSSASGDAPSSSTGAVSLQESPSAPATASATAGVSSKGSTGKAKGGVQKKKNASRASTSTESSVPDLLTQKASMLVEYMLYQYKMKKPIKKADMLKIIHKWYKKDFPEILRRASEHVHLLFGLELKEDKPNGTSYSLVENIGDTGDGSVSWCWRFPTRGILMPLLGVIFLNGNSAPEEEIWEFLNIMGVYDGKDHFIFGEPRKLITQDLVQEKYLVYRQIIYGDFPLYEFLWGPRAQAEISKMQVLEFLAKLNESVITDFPRQYEEALKDEEERARARAQGAPTAGTSSEASGCSSAASTSFPRPE